MALKWLRDNLKSLTWILWVVIAIFIGLIFFDWGGVNRTRSEASEVAASFGDQTVTYSEFRDEYQGLERRYREAFGAQFNADLAKQLNLPMQALNAVINRKLLLMEADAAGIVVTDGELRRAILELPYFQRDDGSFVGSEEYRRRIRHGFRESVEAFERSFREQLRVQRLNEVLRATVWVSDQEVETAYRERTEKAKIRYVQLPATEIQGALEVSDAELQAWYDAHPDDYRLPEQRVADLVLADNAKLRQSLEVPDAELQAYYDGHQAEFTRPEQVLARHILIKAEPDRPDAAARALAEEVKAQLAQGGDFTALAAQHSEDESNKARGGSLGLFGRGQMVKPFEDAAFGAAVGELVGPVQTEFGYHLIEVQSKQPGGLQPFEQAKPVARARLLSEKVEGLAEAKAKDLVARLAKDATKREAAALKALAEEEGLGYETVGPFGRDETVPGIGRVPQFGTAIFALEVGAASEPIKVPRGWVTAVLREIRPPRTQDLAEVREEVRAAVEGSKRREAAKARLAEARATGQSLDAIAASFSLEVQDGGELGRRDPIGSLGRVPEINDAALALDVGAVGGPILAGNGAVLFEVVERQRFDPAAFATAKDSTREQEELDQVRNLLQSVIEARRRDLAPKYDPALVESFQIQTDARQG